MLSIASKNDIEQLMFIENSMFEDSIYFKLSFEEFFKLLNKKSTIVFTWIEDFKIVGYSLGVIINKKHIWFNSLAVLKEYQGTAVAKALFDAIENYALENSFETVILEVREDNKALRRRYKGFKYCEWKTILNYYPDGCSAIRMLKKLK